MRHPAGLATGSAPPVLAGRLPTTTQPPGRIERAVVSPIPPGHTSDAGSDPIVANVRTVPLGETSTIVLPVPCRLALSLKLLTSVSPLTSLPTVINTTATPYGFTSPLGGTVDATCLGLPSVRRNADPEVDRAREAAAIPPAPTNAIPVAMATMSDDSVARGGSFMDSRPFVSASNETAREPSKRHTAEQRPRIHPTRSARAPSSSDAAAAVILQPTTRSTPRE